MDPTPLTAVLGGSRAVAVASVVALSAVHVLAGSLRFLDVIPRSRLLSLAGGASVAYVFVHALPELAHVGSTLDRRIGAVAFVEMHAYLAALFGFVSYYGLERYVRLASDDRPSAGGPGARGDAAGPVDSPEGAFWLHVGSFAVYNGLVGYLLFHREAPGIGAVGPFATAMALHFLVNDYGLRDRHRETYHRYGRWLLAGAVVVGGAIGAVAAIDRAALGVLFAFLSGGIVLNVVKEELPEERESRFSAFAFGAAAYAALLLVL